MQASELDSIYNKYFKKSPNHVQLQKDEVLLQYHQLNQKLYLIHSGTIAGYIFDEDDNRIELFRAREGMYIGVYSFFSTDHIVQAEVTALEACNLTYISSEDYAEEEQEALRYELIPVLLNELSQRQKLSHEVTRQKEQALKKLIYAEKMATLGQMASGLAHELNNAIGVVQGKSEWLTQTLDDLFKKYSDSFYNFFSKGIQKGDFLSTKDVRQQARKIEKNLDIDSVLAKKLARTGMDEGELKKLKKQQGKNFLEESIRLWEVGTSLKDIRISSEHATHVVASVKELGRSKNEKGYIKDIHKTLYEALAITKTLVKHINVEFNFAEKAGLEANKGELVQVWINLIKNACESLVQSQTENPILKIETENKENSIVVSITDNGPGIPKEVSEKIFQPNYTTKKEGLNFGLGLGLTIVQKIINNHKGTIDLIQQPQQTTFKIELPKKQ